MKRILYFALVTLVALPTLISCGKSKEQLEAERNQQALLDATKEELTQALSDRDSLFVLVNDIAGGMEQIKQLENILSAPGMKGETPSARQQIRNDIAAIQEQLQQRRQRLEELEKKLAQSNLNNSNLRNTIDGLKRQIDSQTQEIASLNERLSQANTQIEHLTAQVDTLNTTVVRTQEELETAQNEATNLADELNTCYYAIGTNKELKEAKIIESGFLRKTKIMQKDFDKNYFTQADKRTLHEIYCNSKKAQIMTNNPQSSYSIVEDERGMKSIIINNPSEFWSLSNFVVIKID